MTITQAVIDSLSSGPKTLNEIDTVLKEAGFECHPRDALANAQKYAIIKLDRQSKLYILVDQCPPGIVRTRKGCYRHRLLNGYLSDPYPSCERALSALRKEVEVIL